MDSGSSISLVIESLAKGLPYDQIPQGVDSIQVVGNVTQGHRKQNLTYTAIDCWSQLRSVCYT